MSTNFELILPNIFAIDYSECIAPASTTAAAPARPRGRPRAFDVDEALDRAIEVFRERGYEATSMAELEHVTGLNKSSLYNTFGSKEELFAQTLQRYSQKRFALIAGVLADGQDGLDDLHRALDAQHAESRSDWGIQGCLAITAMTELGSREACTGDIGSEYRQELGAMVRLPLDRAVAKGEMRSEQVPHAVALLVSLTFGLGVLMRSGAPGTTIDAHFAAMHAMVESWRVSA